MDAGIPNKRKVVVVAGAGARGAYEAGALAHAMPALFGGGLGSTVLLGTSAGAINAALWGSRVHEPDLNKVGEDVKAVWRKIRRPDVFDLHFCELLRFAADFAAEANRIGFANGVATLAAPAHVLTGLLPRVIRAPLNFVVDLPGSVANAVFGGAVDLFSFPFAGAIAKAAGLLDTAPLWKTASEHIDFDRLNSNIERGILDGIGLVATSCPMDASGGRTRIFLKTHDRRVPAAEPDSSIDYIKTDKITAQHVLASAAIPVAFPTIRVDAPAKYAGYYTDGGVRLNAPIEPALKLSATQILVVSSHAASYPKPKSLVEKPQPGLLDVASQTIHAGLADGMIEDLRNVDRINKLVAAAAAQGIKFSNQLGREYQDVDVRVFAPENGKLSPLAAAAAEKLKQSGSADGQALRLFDLLGMSGGRNELLSYLLFDPAFFDLQFTAADEDAKVKMKGWAAFV